MAKNGTGRLAGDQPPLPDKRDMGRTTEMDLGQPSYGPVPSYNSLNTLAQMFDKCW